MIKIHGEEQTVEVTENHIFLYISTLNMMWEREQTWDDLDFDFCQTPSPREQEQVSLTLGPVSEGNGVHGAPPEMRVSIK